MGQKEWDNTARNLILRLWIWAQESSDPDQHSTGAEQEQRLWDSSWSLYSISRSSLMNKASPLPPQCSKEKLPSQTPWSCRALLGGIFHLPAFVCHMCNSCTQRLINLAFEGKCWAVKSRMLLIFKKFRKKKEP